MPRLLVAFLACAHAGKLWADVCTQDDTKGLLFCDKSRSIPARVSDYVKRVPLEAKAAMMQNNAPAFDKLHIPPYQWGSEGLHGPLEPCVCQGTGASQVCKCPTSFPCPSALGAAFNVSLYHMIGQADGQEARAINNLRNHVTQNVYGDGIDYWSPTINMQRDPRWGRNQEHSIA
jgi:beta-glucosidase-like glycosyl hydrolase